MTTQDNHHDETPKTITWEIKPEAKPGDKNPLEFYDALRILLAIYEPAENELQSDKQFTTAEIVKALEEHYLVPQGEANDTQIDGEAIVDYLYALGYRYINTGGLMLQWLMKKKQPVVSL